MHCKYQNKEIYRAEDRESLHPKLLFHSESYHSCHRQTPAGLERISKVPRSPVHSQI